MAFKIIAILHYTLLGMFIKLLETVSKGLFRNRSQNRSFVLGFPPRLQNVRLSWCSSGGETEIRRCQIWGLLCMIENRYAALSQELVNTDPTGRMHVIVEQHPLSSPCNSGRTRWMRRSNRFKTSSYNAESTVWPVGTISLWMMPLLSKAINIVLTYDFCRRFLSPGEDGERHSIDCRLDCESNWKHQVLSPQTMVRRKDGSWSHVVMKSPEVSIRLLSVRLSACEAQTGNKSSAYQNLRRRWCAPCPC